MADVAAVIDAPARPASRARGGIIARLMCGSCNRLAGFTFLTVVARLGRMLGTLCEGMKFMVASRSGAGWLGAGVALSLLVLAPAFAATMTPSKPARKAASALSFSMPSGIGSFTPAIRDSSRAAGLAGGALSAGGFRFTPSASPSSRRAVTVAVRARATTKAEAQRTAALTASAITPSAYNLGVSVGWKRFQLSGDIAKIEGGLLPVDREAVDVGLSYNAPKWSTRLQLGADRSVGTRPVAIGPEHSYSVDVGGSYSVTSNLAVTGGVRYKLQSDRLDPIADDERRDSQAVYIGTAFRF
ncbi:hypothetical protein ABC347_13285 [Sphingomonas sp. 1P06PA]|uniref:hypothetical protein n=1 Tax=Sphingomonas sp. 1P06PA TaxID=554121 RepID=UPI0039A74CFB